MKLVVGTFLVLTLPALLPQPAPCATWYITPNGTGDLPTIQDAFDVAVSGDVVLLSDGTFSGPGNSDADMIFPVSGRITLISENGAAFTTIDCMGLSGLSITAVNTIWCTVSGITFINASGPFSGLMIGWKSGMPGAIRAFATVESNVLQNLLLCYGSSEGRCYVLDNQLSNCHLSCSVSKNIVEGNSGSGWVTANGDSVAVRNNTFAGAVADAIVACENWSPSIVHIEGNQITDNVTSRAISVVSTPASSLGMVIRNNVVKMNLDGGGSSRGGLYLLVSSSVINVTVEQNVVGLNELPGMFVVAQAGVPSSFHVVGNTFSENASGVELNQLADVSVVFENNIVAFGSAGAGVTCSGNVTFSCNNLYGNPGGDAICGADGGGNFSRDPIFCGNLGSCNYTLRSISPCAPGNHPDAVNCGLIGARPVACSILGDICWHVENFAGLTSPYAPIFGSNSLWCGARPGPPPFDTYLSLPGYGNNWNPSFESIEFVTAGDVTVKYTARWDLDPGDEAWLEYLDKDNTWNPFSPLAGSSLSAQQHTIPATELAGRIKLRFRFASDGVGSDEDGVDTDGAVTIDSLSVTDSMLGVIDYQDFEGEAVGATETADGHWYCANPPTVVPHGTRVPFALHPAFPNPFNPSTTIRYTIGRSTRVSLAVHDVTGRTVRVLVDEHRAPGAHDATWDGRDSRGQRVSSGVYFYRLRAAGFTRTRKLVLLK